MDTKNQAKTLRRVIELRKQGVSFREIEQRLTKSLGLAAPGNGTAALRAARKAAA